MSQPPQRQIPSHCHHKRKQEQIENKLAYEQALEDLKQVIMDEEGPEKREELREERTLAQRVKMALVCAAIFGTGVLTRVLTSNFPSSGAYPALDLGLEGSLVMGMLGGYVTGMLAGILISLPAMFGDELMSMPLLAAAGSYTPFYLVAMSWVPVLSTFRFPAKYIVLAAFALACGAAAGWDALSRESADEVSRDSRAGRWTSTFVLVVLAGAAAATAASSSCAVVSSPTWKALRKAPTQKD